MSGGAPAKAALGSSYYALPAPLSWFTANIGVHHVHHLCSRIPYYRLPEVLRGLSLASWTQSRQSPPKPELSSSGALG